MKKVTSSIAILLSIVFLVNTLLSGVYLSYFLLSKRDFVATYCKNKMYPERHCEGSCKFAQVTKEQTDYSTSEKKTITMPEVFFQEFPKLVFIKHFSKEIIHNYHYTPLSLQEVIHIMFRPPISLLGVKF